ncbi:expressed protein [Chlorella variabilis]|uniref:Expressed protein n=1 Tax=Chlorella variabilis TaxID=554065 RepID=E1ZSY0_CHLVA|nr:expressed protein [Chlorella variabilis]EFN51086.1 expressed protein [Chlorella variabilis]|eukprot:XP_005843188.1 expressed protein [Chlorella variabilis]
MQTSAQIFRAGASPAVAARAARRSSVVRCQAPQGLSPIQEAAKGAALAAATLGLVLGSGMPALAAKPTPSAFEQRAAYEQELLESLKARGKDLPALTSSPEAS